MSKKAQRPIRAFLFDLGKVILYFDFDPAFRRLSRVSGIPVKEIEDFFIASGLEVLYDGGKITSKRFFNEVRKGLGLRISFRRFESIWNDIFTPNREIIRLIRRLSKTHRLVLISNTNEMHYKFIQKKYTVLNCFDKIILSFREKIRKPDERIYRLASKACRAPAGQILYIDDRPDLTTAAADLGFQVFTYKNNFGELLQLIKSKGNL